MNQDKVTFNHGKAVKFYIVYEISISINIKDYLTLKNCLFGAVTVTKNADINKYKYSGYGVGGNGRNVIIFGRRLITGKRRLITGKKIF